MNGLSLRFAAVLLAPFLLGLAAGTALAEDADLAYGRQLVEANCARCHAVGLDDESAHPEAPAFRTLSER